MEKRLAILESVNCPHCKALEAMSEEELDARIQGLASGQCVPDDLPEPSPSCPRCQKAAAMSEEELDAQLARLNGILQDAIG